MTVARGGWGRRLPMSSRRFTRLSPSATDVALVSVTSRAVSSCSTRDEKELSSDRMSQITHPLHKHFC